jgi:CDP-6-deoxy-D-xylo-4-hexulose-3-dehydrase
MNNRISESDIERLMGFFRRNPRLTQSHEVAMFEKEWSHWLGVKHSVFVNSGSSANLITMAALKHLYGDGEVIVPTLTWVSDIASVLQNGFKPVFVDINPQNLCMDTEQVLPKLSSRTRAVFLTHVQGFNGLTDRLLRKLAQADVPLIEDVSESHGATFKGKRLGSFGLISNFSFYFAHHMSTIEGGMVCTNDATIYEWLRMLRSHGMVREASNDDLKQDYIERHPELSPDFIFALPAFNVRNTEIGAVLGRSQLKRLNAENRLRTDNFKYFLNNLDSEKYRTDFDLQGSCNYALNLVIRNPDPVLRDGVEAAMKEAGIEYRRGSSGGGNQLRQPYLKGIVPEGEWEKYPQTEHIHFYGYYIGNYPELKKESIDAFCRLLNAL